MHFLSNKFSTCTVSLYSIICLYIYIYNFWSLDVSIKNCKRLSSRFFDEFFDLWVVSYCSIWHIYIDIALSGKLSNFKSHKHSPFIWYNIIFISLNWGLATITCSISFFYNKHIYIRYKQQIYKLYILYDPNYIILYVKSFT